MKTLRWCFLTLIVAIVGTMAWTDSRLAHYEELAKQAGARAEIARAAYAESLTFVKRDTLRVTKWATRYDTIRAFITDSVITDTIATVPAYWVKTLIVAADSTVAACRDLVSSTRGALTACDSAQAALSAKADAYKKLADARKPTWKARFGISCGYSVVKLGPDLKAGPSCGATFRLVP